ncbi:hypothetical protein D3C75_1155240 [compost metagenome]
MLGITGLGAFGFFRRFSISAWFVAVSFAKGETGEVFAVVAKAIVLILLQLLLSLDLLIGDGVGAFTLCAAHGMAWADHPGIDVDLVSLGIGKVFLSLLIARRQRQRVPLELDAFRVVAQR